MAGEPYYALSDFIAPKESGIQDYFGGFAVTTGIGIDALPETIRNSSVLTGNNLGQLANVHEYPTVDPTFEDDKLKNIIQYFSINPDEMDQELHKYAKELLDAGKVSEAWQVLLADS